MPPFAILDIQELVGWLENVPKKMCGHNSMLSTYIIPKCINIVNNVNICNEYKKYKYIYIYVCFRYVYIYIYTLAQKQKAHN